jgi:hypothetical protein
VSARSKWHAYSITASARGKQRRRRVYAERLRGFEINHQLEFGRLLDR